MDLVKRKWKTTEEPIGPKMNASAILMTDAKMEDEIPDTHFTKTHWAHATIETLVRIRNIKEPMISLSDHGLKINLMSKDFYQKMKWSIKTDHIWKIRTDSKAKKTYTQYTQMC